MGGSINGESIKICCSVLVSQKPGVSGFTQILIIIFSLRIGCQPDIIDHIIWEIL